MKQVIVTCIERNTAKTYIGELISNDIGLLIISIIDKKGSSKFKYIKKEKICNMTVQEMCS